MPVGEAGDLRTALRAASREAHAVLDGALAPHGRVHGVGGYRTILGALHALHDEADAPLAHWAGRSPLGASLRARLPSRAPLYAADLAALGSRVEQRSRDHEGLTDGAALGLLYLVAGSAAGARVLLRALPAGVPAEAARGLADAAAPGSTHLWRSTVELLRRRHAPEVQDAAVHRALTTMAALAPVPR